jgi:hypothetical protein
MFHVNGLILYVAPHTWVFTKVCYSIACISISLFLVANTLFYGYTTFYKSTYLLMLQRKLGSIMGYVNQTFTARHWTLCILSIHAFSSTVVTLEPCTCGYQGSPACISYSSRSVSVVLISASSKWYRASFYMLPGHFYVFFGRMSLDLYYTFGVIFQL